MAIGFPLLLYDQEPLKVGGVMARQTTVNWRLPLLVGRAPMDIIVLGKSINLQFTFSAMRPPSQLLHPSGIINFSIAVFKKAPSPICIIFCGRMISRNEGHQEKAELFNVLYL